MSKITLITSPDYYENNNYSICFVDINEEQQKTVTQWLSKRDNDVPINIYYIDNNSDLDWSLYTFNTVDITYANFDGVNSKATWFVSWMSAYIAAKPNVYYQATLDHTSELLKRFNTHNINIEDFLKLLETL